MTERHHVLAFLAATVLLAILSVTNVSAQNWSQCTNGAAITKCETYDCPNGDTNNDGSCTLQDSGARLTDVRNDSFCANPISGCGEVKYFSANSSNACSTRVEQTGNNCNLYSVGSPTFTPTPTPTSTPSATPTPAGSNTELVCSGLVVSKTSGVAPLTVSFEAKASGKVANISQYEFVVTRPNGVSGTIEQANSKLSQTFTTEGKYIIEAKLVDAAGKKYVSSLCKKEVEVLKAGIGGGDVGSGTTTKGGEKLPETGIGTYIGVVFVAMGALGIFLYEKFRFV